MEKSKLLQGARNLKNKGYTPEQVDAWLKTKGSSIKEIQEYVNTPKNVVSFKAGETLGNKGVLKDFAKGFLGGIKLGLENVADSASLGVYSKINELLGGDYDKRVIEQQQLADDYGLGTLNLAARGATFLGGAGVGAPAKIYTKLASTGLKGLKLPVAAGMIEGGISNALESNDASDILPRTLIGSTVGGVAGLAGDLVTRGVGKAIDYALPRIRAPKNVMRNLEEDVGSDILRKIADEAEETGRSAIEVGDDNLINRAIQSKINSPQANRLFVNKAQNLAEGQTERNLNAINSAFGNKGKIETAQMIKEETRRKAQPIYNELNERGSLNSLPLIVAIKQNPVLKDTIQHVKRTNPSLSKLRDDDFRVLNEARKLLSTQSLDKTGIAGYDARNALKQLDPILDETIPEYRLARGVYLDQNRFLDAQNFGAGATKNNITAESFLNDLGKMTDSEVRAARIGARDKILNDIQSAENQTLGLKRLANENSRQKLRGLLGENADDLLDYSADEIRRMRNVNKLLGGSQTAEKVSLAGLNKSDIINKTQDVITSELKKREADYLAELLTQNGAGMLKDALIRREAQIPTEELLNSLINYGSVSFGNKLTDY